MLTDGYRSVVRHFGRIHDATSPVRDPRAGGGAAGDGPRLRCPTRAGGRPTPSTTGSRGCARPARSPTRVPARRPPVGCRSPRSTATPRPRGRARASATTGTGGRWTCRRRRAADDRGHGRAGRRPGGRGQHGRLDEPSRSSCPRQPDAHRRGRRRVGPPPDHRRVRADQHPAQPRRGRARRGRPARLLALPELPDGAAPPTRSCCAR